MNISRPQPTAINATDHIDVTFGAFDLSGFRVPYMSSVLRVQQVSEYLKLVTEHRDYVLRDWSLDELFQRDVDQARVHEIAGTYLSAESERPQFFNALTVVVWPDDASTSGSFTAPPEDDRFKHSIDMGPIRVNADILEETGHPRPGTFGSVCWNRDQVRAVAIDGQHRLAALKELYKRDSDRAAGTTVSCLFLVIDQRLGFRSPSEIGRLDAMRSIFIDLNKRALPVTRARNLLLDDLDPQARFVRSLLGSQLKTTFPNNDKGQLGFPVGSAGEFDTVIPLSLVDWHGEQRSKIESGPYVTSILAVDWIVKKVLGANGLPFGTISDLYSLSPDDENYWDKIRGDLVQWPATWASRLQERYEEVEREGAFFLSKDDVHGLGAEFASVWGRPLTRLLTCTAAYKELTELRLSAGTLEPTFSQWIQAQTNKEISQRHTTAVTQHYSDRLNMIEQAIRDSGGKISDFRDLLDKIEDLKESSVFFLLVGQRALVFSLIELIRRDEWLEWAEAIEVAAEDFVNNPRDFYAYFLSTALTTLYQVEPALFRKDFRIHRDPSGLTSDLPAHFWAGSLVRKEAPEQVDFSEKAAERGERWFTVAAILYWFARANPHTDLDDVVRAVDEPDVLDGLAFGRDLNSAIGNALGAHKPSTTYYRSPMCFLSTILEEIPEGAEGAATRERVAALVRIVRRAV